MSFKATPVLFGHRIYAHIDRNVLGVGFTLLRDNPKGFHLRLGWVSIGSYPR